MLDGEVQDIAWTHQEPYCIVAVGNGMKRVSGVGIDKGTTCGDLKGPNSDVFTVDINPSNGLVVAGKDNSI